MELGVQEVAGRHPYDFKFFYYFASIFMVYYQII